MEQVVRYLDSAVYAVPGQSLGSLRIGMGFQQVVDTLGPPLRSDREGFLRRRTVLIYQSGINAWLKIVGDKAVEEIGLEGDPSIQTPEGVRIGMPRHQVVLIYGKEFEEEDDILRYTRRGIQFTFQSGRLYQMNIFPVVTEKD